MDAAKYAATEQLRTGEALEIWALQPSDRTGMLAAVGRFSSETLYRRFFAPKRSFSEREIDFFLNVDFVNHVALVAVITEGGRQVIVGGARYVVAQAGSAEVALQSTARTRSWHRDDLIRHLIELGRTAGLEEFVAEVLAGNAPMLKVFERCGLGMTTFREGGVLHVTLALRRAAES